jgi:glycosyltransferase involved in cell wall biosynthesis
LLGQRTGVGEVAEGLVRALAARDDVHPVVYALTWRGRNDLAQALPAGVTSATARMPARVVRELWTRGASWPRAEHWTGPVDVVHALNYVAPPSRAPVIVMVHDLTFVRFPGLCTPDTLRYRGLVHRAIRQGAVVHTPSEFVADEVRAEFDISPDRVVAIHSGLAPVTGGDPAAGAALAGGGRYVLALGTIEPRKNVPGLVRAFSTLAAEDPDVRLVVAGPDGWDQEQFAAAVARSPSRDRIVRLGYVSSDSRRDLLAGATVFAYPSRYEGFGLPPLEAMSVGVPVVAGRAGALPEVLGDAAVLVDPADDDELARVLAQLLADASIRDDLVARGRERAARYTWHATAERVVQLYRSLA